MKYAFLFVLFVSAHTVFAQYSTNKIEYDGIYLDLGNGKYMKLQEMEPTKGVIVARYGGRETHYYSNTPCMGDLTKSVNVAKVKKIILQGGAYKGDFSDHLSFSAIENFNAKQLTRDGDGRIDSVKVMTYAGQFGSAYSMTATQPPVLYVPEIEKGSFEHFVTLEFDKKTNSETTSELVLSAPLQKGKTYALWNSKKFWLFTIN